MAAYEETLRAMMEEKPAGTDGRWVLMREEAPPSWDYGLHEVIKLGRSRHLDYDKLLWNGAYWVTHGHGVCNSVEAWYDKRGELVEDGGAGDGDPRDRVLPADGAGDEGRGL